MTTDGKPRTGLPRAAAWTAALALAGVLCAAATSPPKWSWRLPPGVAPPPVPADNPMSAVKVELGRQLFYEADLSADGTMACATCHEQRHGFTDTNRTHPGIHGDAGRRNIMALANIAYYRSYTWADPTVTRLEQQAAIPMMGEHPVEMGMGGQAPVLIERLAKDACYRDLFARAFPERRGAVDTTTIAMALAAFERTLISRDTPYDRFRRGRTDAISDAAKRGRVLFMGARLHCASCHAGPDFTDAEGGDPRAAFHDIGLPPQPDVDRGLAEITGDARDEGRFRTPSLRNVALTGPYMHDGSVPTLAEAVRRHAVAATLTDAEIEDVTAFLRSLTDGAFVNDPDLGLPKHQCGR